MGLCEVDGIRWPYVAWRNYMLDGPHCDERSVGLIVDNSGRRSVGLHDRLAFLWPVDYSKQKDYPHHGPSAAAETLHGVWASGRELIAYDEMWCSQSGIHPHSATRAEHRAMLHTLASTQSWDQSDPKMIEHALDERAGLATLESTQHLVTVAEADARILKQNRLLRPELAAQGPTPLLPVADGDGDDDATPAPSARSKKRAAKGAAAATRK